jgi:hypothetical protein
MSPITHRDMGPRNWHEDHQHALDGTCLPSPAAE